MVSKSATRRETWAYRYQRALAESVHPILVPEQRKQLIIEGRLEDFHVDLIVLIRMNTKVLNLAQRNRLIFGR